MNYLLVVAHPDDEVLGAGATIYKLAQQGHSVNVCILSSEANARNHRPDICKLYEDIEKSKNILGVNRVIPGNFPNIEFNVVPHLHLVQFIEKVIIDTKAEVIFTHHPADLNNDHYHTSIACQAAARLFQRGGRPDQELPSLRNLYFMEVPSATEWSLNRSMNHFVPNTFMEVGEEGICKKIEALSQYRGVMRDHPHPRSVELIQALATYRGAQAGMTYAEAFESVLRRLL